jgi:hypothetical protein
MVVPLWDTRAVSAMTDVLDSGEAGRRFVRGGAPRIGACVGAISTSILVMAVAAIAAPVSSLLVAALGSAVLAAAGARAACRATRPAQRSAASLSLASIEHAGSPV